jgi:hypothetical protein
MVEGFIGGAGSGGMMGGLTSGRGIQTDALINEAVEKGIKPEEIDAAQEIVKNQIVNKADEIEKVLDKSAKEVNKPLAAELPTFKTTREAVDFGKQATPEQVEKLKAKREQLETELKGIEAIEKPTPEQTKRGFEITGEAQFAREAVEAAEGRFKEVVKPEEQALITEAKKYKTAEEFAERQLKKEDDRPLYKEVRQLAKETQNLKPEQIEAKVIERFGKDPEITLYRGISPELRPDRFEADVEAPVGRFWAPNQALSEQFVRETGSISKVTIKVSDLLKSRLAGETSLRVNEIELAANLQKDIKTVTTTSQLTDIWKKAQEKPAKITSTAAARREAVTRPLGEGKPRIPTLVQRVGDNLISAQEAKGMTYNRLNIAKDAALAVDFLEKHPDRAKRIAYNQENPPQGITGSAIREAYRFSVENNIEEYKRVVQAEAYREVRLGQEIATLKEWRTATDPINFIKDVIAQRLKNISVSDIVYETTKAKKGTQKGGEIRMRREINTAKKIISPKSLRFESAQKVLDSITC